MARETVTLKYHLAALRKGDLLFDKERDRRYAEVNLEREKALKIKETADLKALDLAREIQIYKDEKANQLREQINSERGLYVTKAEFEPVKVYIAGQTGKSSGIGITLQGAVQLVTTIVGIIAIIIAFVATRH